LQRGRTARQRRPDQPRPSARQLLQRAPGRDGCRRGRGRGRARGWRGRVRKYSADGQCSWDGSQWLPVQQVAPSAPQSPTEEAAGRGDPSLPTDGPGREYPSPPSWAVPGDLLPSGRPRPRRPRLGQRRPAV